MNPLFVELIVRERMKERLQEAELVRLAQTALPKRPALRQRSLVWLGHKLTAAGSYLLESYTRRDEVPPDPKHLLEMSIADLDCF